MVSNCTVKIDPYVDAITQDTVNAIMCSEDIDSAIGVGDCIPFKMMGALYMIPNFKDTLTQSVHWTHTFQTDIDGVSGCCFKAPRRLRLNNESQVLRSVHVPLHKIPNVGYIKIADRHIGRIFLPALYNKEGDAAVSTQVLVEIFEVMHYHCVELQGMEDGHIPPTYDAEMSRQTFHGSQPGTSSVMIRPADMVQFTRTVLHQIRQEPWGRNAFWFNQFRGFRAGTSIAINEGTAFGPASATEAFERMSLECVPDLIIPKDWRFDLGWEVHCEGEVLHWRCDAFPQMLAQWLQVSDPDASSMCKSASFNFDSAAQLHDVGGFRYEPSRSDGERSGVTYMQAYCTESHLVHKPGERHSALNVTFSDVVKDGAQAYCKRMIGIFTDAEWTSANARAEVRVTGDRLTEIAARVPFTSEKLLTLLIDFPAGFWFRFKSLRLAAIGMLLNHWFTAKDVDNRVSLDALQLAAVLIWSANALNNRPEDMASERALASSICPARFNHGEWEVEYNHYGLHLIASISFHPLRNSGIAFVNTPLLEPEVLQKLMGNQYNIAGLKRILEGNKRSAARGDPAGSTTLVKRRRITNKSQAETATLPAGAANPFRLEEDGYDLPGSDDPPSDDDARQQRNSARRRRGLNEIVWSCWCQFLKDVLHKFPQPNNVGPHAQDAYHRWPQSELENHSDKALQRVNLADVFTRVRTQNSNVWREMFEIWFPNSQVDTGSTSQQYWQAFQYLTDYFRLRSLLSKEAWDAVRAALRRQFDSQLAWVPKANTERPWWTSKKRHTGTTYHGEPYGTQHPCPVVALNRAQFNCSFVAGQSTPPSSW
jgi:hypothetical protein